MDSIFLHTLLLTCLHSRLADAMKIVVAYREFGFGDHERSLKISKDQVRELVTRKVKSVQSAFSVR